MSQANSYIYSYRLIRTFLEKIEPSFNATVVEALKINFRSDNIRETIIIVVLLMFPPIYMCVKLLLQYE